MVFHELWKKTDIIGYGGAAGGGKSDLALGLALRYHRRSLILRREFRNVRALIDRSREIIGDRGRFNGQDAIWRLPEGRQIEFGGCLRPGDEQSYRGRPHDLVVFDEADQFQEQMVRFISGWLRTTIVGQPCRMLLTFNPPSSADGDQRRRPGPAVRTMSAPPAVGRHVRHYFDAR
jgi:hypothetical protein